jgi:hypothetical protein
MKHALFALAALVAATPVAAHYDAKPPSIAGEYTCTTPDGFVSFHMTLEADNKGRVHGSGGASVNWLDSDDSVLVVRADDESRVVAYFNPWNGNALIPDRTTLVPAICAAGLADML